MTDSSGISCAVEAPGDSTASTERTALLFGSAHLEQQIEAAKQRLCAAPERSEKLRHWREMCRLIDQRTPEQVAALEARRGLRT